jgi:hypothetical protein
MWYRSPRRAPRVPERAHPRRGTRHLRATLPPIRAFTAGGILSCGLTHTAVTPLDVVKCRLQTMPGVYTSLGTGFALTRAEGNLLLGWLPTLLGYSTQGMFKVGGVAWRGARGGREGPGVCVCGGGGGGGGGAP